MRPVQVLRRHGWRAWMLSGGAVLLLFYVSSLIVEYPGLPCPSCKATPSPEPRRFPYNKTLPGSVRRASSTGMQSLKTQMGVPWEPASLPDPTLSLPAVTGSSTPVVPSSPHCSRRPQGQSLVCRWGAAEREGVRGCYSCSWRTRGSPFIIRGWQAVRVRALAQGPGLPQHPGPGDSNAFE